MARITVEDCLENVENRFELVMIASKRARQIQTGGKDPLVPEDNDKPTVLALREIAAGLVDVSILLDTSDYTAADSAAEFEAAELAAAAKNDISIEDAMGAELAVEESEGEEVAATPDIDDEQEDA